MIREVAGVRLSSFEEPIAEALKHYTTVSDGTVDFLDANEAMYLEPTPDKPYSARSTTTVTYLGETIGKMHIIAFAPFDGTGDESTHKLKDYIVPKAGGWPRDPKIVPRSKTTIHTEAHLAIAAHQIDSPQTNARLYANHLQVLGIPDTLIFPGDCIVNIAVLGPNYDTFYAGSATNNANITVGYIDLRGHWNDTIGERRRVGDPHAIYNPLEDTVQVAGFLAISHDQNPKHLDALRQLGVQEPYEYVHNTYA